MNIKTILVLLAVGINSIAYGAEPIKVDPAKNEPVKAEPKKSESKQPEMKTVCKPMKDNSGKVLKDKQGKDREQCKTIKVHKKHEGKPANVKEQKK